MSPGALAVDKGAFCLPCLRGLVCKPSCATAPWPQALRARHATALHLGEDVLGGALCSTQDSLT